jgi:pimeloyl-ACP methyl ester carboxylesterase
MPPSQTKDRTTATAIGIASHDPRLGRFIQRDALRSQAIQQHYVYTRNTPALGRDPSGLLTIIVHGTWARGGKWWRPTGMFAKQLDAGLRSVGHVPDVWSVASAGNVTVGEVPALATFGRGGVFEWSGDNTPQARRLGAEQLASYITAVRARFPREEINVVTHSHGGNVAKLATGLGARIDNLVLIAAPHLSRDVVTRIGLVRQRTAWLYTANPANVGQALNISSEEDIVQGMLAGGTNNGEDTLSARQYEVRGVGKRRGR